MHQVEEHIRRGLAGEAVLLGDEAAEILQQPGLFQQLAALQIPVGGDIVLHAAGMQRFKHLRDIRNRRQTLDQFGLLVPPEGGDQRIGGHIVLCADHIAAVAQVLLHQGESAFLGDGNAEIRSASDERPHHRRIGIQQRPVKIPEDVFHLAEGQPHRHRPVGRAQVKVQQLPGRDEARVLVLGQDGQRSGFRGEEGEADTAMGVLGVLPHIGDGQGELLHQLSDEAVRRGFARFPLAAGEFPQVGVIAAFAPLADQDPALAVIHDAGGNFDHVDAPLGSSTLF